MRPYRLQIVLLIALLATWWLTIPDHVKDEPPGETPPELHWGEPVEGPAEDLGIDTTRPECRKLAKEIEAQVASGAPGNVFYIGDCDKRLR
jgi:hypothetical protein